MDNDAGELKLVLITIRSVFLLYWIINIDIVWGLIHAFYNHNWPVCDGLLIAALIWSFIIKQVGKYLTKNTIVYEEEI